jgi:hypothetical protein
VLQVKPSAQGNPASARPLSTLVIPNSRDLQENMSASSVICLKAEGRPKVHSHVYSNYRVGHSALKLFEAPSKDLLRPARTLD